MSDAPLEPEAAPAEPPPYRTLVAWADGSGNTMGQHTGIGVVVLEGDVVLVEASDTVGLGTNQIAELCAVRRAINLVFQITRSRQTALTIHTDSAWTIGAVQRGSRWKLKANPALSELGYQTRAEIERWPRLTFAHCKGHSGLVHNERCDVLAGQGRRRAEARASAAP